MPEAIRNDIEQVIREREAVAANITELGEKLNKNGLLGKPGVTVQRILEGKFNFNNELVNLYDEQSDENRTYVVDPHSDLRSLTTLRDKMASYLVRHKSMQWARY